MQTSTIEPKATSKAELLELKAQQLIWVVIDSRNRILTSLMSKRDAELWLESPIVKGEYTGRGLTVASIR